MKTVNIIAINARYSHTNLAVLYMREAISDLDWTCKIKNFTINTPFYDILEGLAKGNPDVLAFSVYIWNAELMKQLLPELKKILPKSKIILGGPEVSYNHSEWTTQFKDIDFIVIGAGEKGFRELIQTGLDYPEQIVNIGAHKFDDVAFPYHSQDFIDAENKILYYESSRGCPFKCTFCLSSRDDQKLDYRSLDKIYNELDLIVEHGPKLIKFVDRSFNAKAKIAREIWRYIISLKSTTLFHFELHPLLLQDEDYELLTTAPKGIFQFEIGIQTLNEQSQEAIRRRNHWHRMKPNIERLIALGNIHVHVDFICGLPHEDWNSTRNSFNGIYDLNADVMQFGFLKVIPDTSMYYQQESLGLIHTDSAPYQILKTNWLNFEELAKLREMEQCLNAIYNSEQFNTTEHHLISWHKSPFDAYLKIANFASENSLLANKSWSKVAQWILDYTQHSFPEKLPFILDCLRWDYVQLTKSRTYPNYLSSPADKAILLIKKSVNTLFEYNELRLNDKVFKTGIFYLADTEQFQSELTDQLYFWVDEDDKRSPHALSLSQNLKSLQA